jgi:hypothetical protein
VVLLFVSSIASKEDDEDDDEDDDDEDEEEREDLPLARAKAIRKASLLVTVVWGTPRADATGPS